jgi:hypothetical protein
VAGQGKTWQNLNLVFSRQGGQKHRSHALNWHRDRQPPRDRPAICGGATVMDSDFGDENEESA